MIDQDILHGHWQDIRDRVRQRWQLSDDELQRIDGDVDRLVGLIQLKSGEARERIEDFLEDVAATASSRFEGARQRAGEYVRGRAEEAYHKTDEALRDIRARTEDVVQRRPIESVVVAFGVGVLTGLLAGFTCRSR